MRPPELRYALLKWVRNKFVVASLIIKIMFRGTRAGDLPLQSPAACRDLKAYYSIME